MAFTFSLKSSSVMAAGEEEWALVEIPNSEIEIATVVFIVLELVCRGYDIDQSV